MLRALLLITAGLVMNAQAVAQVKNPGTVVKAISEEWTTLDPAQCYDLNCGEVLHNLFDTLVGYNGSNPQIVPLLAREVPTRANGGISADGRTYTFKLRPNLRFTDGTPVTARDVEYSLRRMLVVAAATGPAQLLSEPLLGTPDLPDAKENPDIYAVIERAIRATDPHTVTIRLAQPFAPFLTILTNPYFSVYSRSAAIRAGAWSGTARDWAQHNHEESGPFQRKQPLGSGPYKLAVYDPPHSLVMVHNVGYWRGPARIRRVAIQVVPEDSTRMLMMRAGDVDIIDLPPALLSQLEGVPGVVVTRNLPAVSLNGLFLNQKVTGHPEQLGSGKLDGQGIPANFFSDVHVRRGFAYSIDRKTIVKEILAGQGIARQSLAISGLASEQPGVGYGYDPKKAEQEFRRVFGGQLWQKGFVLPVYATNDPVRNSILQLLKRNVEALNPKFRVEVQQLTTQDYFARRSKGELTAWVGNWTLDYYDPHNLFEPWTGPDGTYATAQHYSNPQIDRLLHQAIVETVPAKRQALYRQVQGLQARDAFGIPLYQVVDSGIRREWLGGRNFNLATVGDSFYEMNK
ncbi:peptide ABC transporter substrate-binding protein (plasmid) [Deinococcus aetherius]|uniref:Peptide ABC transporter substrate-binding protein n=1 Tax=Deinococcus aetherius TaxID=200252 RepID=A0ABM8AKX3_9DEIO|nr:ABC transporter substrate-binding protein [Deinococcus aetherius]BDP44485.1 peptide ABC transporter substrate-binding protein [Deinococcus aetherius]